jgi:hypothetical protein
VKPRGEKVLEQNMHLFEKFNFNRSISMDAIEAAEEKLNIKFPQDYADFMLRTNGGEGTIGEGYLRLYKMEDLALVNEDYSADEFAPGFVIIGSDGGAAAFGYDFRERVPQLIEVGFIGMDIDYPAYRTDDFYEFMEYLYNF